MCIACDMKELNRLHASAAEALVESLVELTHSMQSFIDKARPSLPAAMAGELEALQSHYERVMGGAQAAQSEAPPLDREGLAKMLAEAFPDAKVIVGSPEEVNAAFEHLTSGKKPN